MGIVLFKTNCLFYLFRFNSFNISACSSGVNVNTFFFFYTKTHDCFGQYQDNFFFIIDNGWCKAYTKPLP